jgi:hypothetical protein
MEYVLTPLTTLPGWVSPRPVSDIATAPPFTHPKLRNLATSSSSTALPASVGDHAELSRTGNLFIEKLDFLILIMHLHRVFYPLGWPDCNGENYPFGVWTKCDRR